MPGADLLKEPFLPPQQEALLGSYYDLMNNLGLPSKTGVPFKDQVHEANKTFKQTEVESIELLKQAPRDQTTYEGLEQTLQLIAFKNVGIDLKLAVLDRLASLGAGIAKADGDKNEFERASDIGYLAIDFRARHAAKTVLVAFRGVGSWHESIDPEASAWQRSEATHDISPVDCPADISEDDAFNFGQLTDGVIEANPKRKRSSLAAFRVLRGMPSAVRATQSQGGLKDMAGLGGLGLFLNTITTNATLSPELEKMDKAELRHTMRVATELVKCLGFSAITDPSLVQDPTVRHFAYVTNQVRARDISNELANFDTNVNKAARREAKSHKRNKPN